MAPPTRLAPSSPRFVVLKFGGTSVSSRARWETIAQIAQLRCNEAFKTVVVCSALSGVSNDFEKIIQQIKNRQDFSQSFKSIKDLHFKLAKELGIEARVVDSDLQTLEQLLLECSLVHDVSARQHAHIMAFGEILSTRLGAEFLTRQNLKAAWQDARECLLTRTDSHSNEQRHFLSATCTYEEDDALREHFLALDVDIVLTQGFIARNSLGQTVLLGRGGSDTSASYFAAKLAAERCEIWTDVPGLYTANPRQIRSARILNHLDYDEAQEMATMGAKVLHPRCIAPVKQTQIPLHIRCTNEPLIPGTIISQSASSGVARVKCISTKNQVTLVSIESLGMWQEVGFLADLFAVFKQRGLSIDLVSTSETNVTVSIDSVANALTPGAIDALALELSQFGKVKLLSSCATVSLIGRNIRSILHQLGPALRVFEEQKVYLVSQAASDLNLSFVVQEEESARLVQDLHNLLFDQIGKDPVFGPSWQDTFAGVSKQSPSVRRAWWEDRSSELIDLAQCQSPLYVYDEKTLENSARALQSLRCIDHVFYAMKANDNEEVLKIFHALGIGFECVSVFEMNLIFKLFPDIDPRRVLFTPNFAPRLEYEEAFARGCLVTLDNLYPLEHWPEVFAGREILLRLDPGEGLGHHKHVKTAGEQSKFGISVNQIPRAIELVAASNAIVIGLHAHAGSGITKPSHWATMAGFLLSVAEQFPSVEILNLGGGLFVPSQPEDDALDLTEFDAALSAFKSSSRGFQFWLEPGRFLVADAGVLLTRVTQLKDKGDTKFVGVDAGMNALIRPALYGAYHHIVNLSRIDEATCQTTHVVGPICESGDTLGYDRKLPATFEGDVVLVANAGAYGRVMSSRYNRRPDVDERVLSCPKTMVG